MSTKTKAFIGITISFVVLIILFASNGGFRGARAASLEAVKKHNTCSVEEKAETSENIAQVEAK